MTQLYREIILDYYMNPRNKGQIKDVLVSATDWNPLCGDKIRFDLKFDDNGRVVQAKFDGEGCAISQAAASMLTEKVEGMNQGELGRLNEKDILDMLGVEVSPGRKKCALLAWLVMRKALNQGNP